MKFEVQSLDISNLKQNRQLIAISTNLIDDSLPENPILTTFGDSIIIKKNITDTKLKNEIVSFLIPAILKNYEKWKEEQDRKDKLVPYKTAFENKLNEVFV